MSATTFSILSGQPLCYDISVQHQSQIWKTKCAVDVGKAEDHYIFFVVVLLFYYIQSRPVLGVLSTDHQQYKHKFRQGFNFIHILLINDTQTLPDF